MPYTPIPSTEIETGDIIKQTTMQMVKDNLDYLNTKVTTAAPTVALSGNVIDWSLSSSFMDTITANKTYAFSNNSDARTIVVLIRNNSASTVTLGWPAGTIGASTTILANTYKIFTFIQFGSLVFASSLEF